jgi:Skp family chaperone for outer membrane proteins
MKSKFSLLVAGFFTLLLAVQPAAAQTLKIGVVRFTSLVNGYTRMQAEQDAGLKKRDQLRLEQTGRTDEINRLNAKLQQHTPDSEAYKKTEDELRQKKADLETWTRVKTDELMSDETRIIREIYEDVDAASAEYGKKNGFALILKEDDLDLVKAGLAELKVKVALRKILYFDPSLDITDAIVKVLNDRYQARQK